MVLLPIDAAATNKLVIYGRGHRGLGKSGLFIDI
jgi:hypothetical protein